jgi:hypothetical protein
MYSLYGNQLLNIVDTSPSVFHMRIIYNVVPITAQQLYVFYSRGDDEKMIYYLLLLIFFFINFVHLFAGHCCWLHSTLTVWRQHSDSQYFTWVGIHTFFMCPVTKFDLGWKKVKNMDFDSIGISEIYSLLLTRIQIWTPTIGSITLMVA